MDIPQYTLNNAFLLISERAVPLRFMEKVIRAVETTDKGPVRSWMRRSNNRHFKSITLSSWFFSLSFFVILIFFRMFSPNHLLHNPKRHRRGCSLGNGDEKEYLYRHCLFTTYRWNIFLCQVKKWDSFIFFPFHWLTISNTHWRFSGDLINWILIDYFIWLL